MNIASPIASTAEPGIVDSRVRRRQPHLIKVSDRVYAGIGYSVSNVLYVLTTTSVVVIDTTEALAAARLSLEHFRHVSTLPVSHILYTHFHGDHIRGARAFHETDTCIIAHRSMPGQLASNNRLLPRRERVNAIQLGTPMPVSPDGVLLNDSDDGYVPPNLLVDDHHRFEQGGVAFELFHAPGETSDHLIAWLSRERIAFCGDLFYRCFPMLSNPLKRDRPVREWIASLDRLRGLGAEHLVPSHGPPVRGADRIRTLLGNYADAIRHVYDRALQGVRDGLNAEQIAKNATLPTALAALPYLQERYGTLRWAAQGIVRQHTSWYDGDPACLNPVPRRARSAAILAASGGPAPLLQRATGALTRGYDQVVLELTDIVLDVHDAHPRARALRQTALKRLAQKASNRLEHNIYQVAANEMLVDAPKATSSADRVAPRSRSRKTSVPAQVPHLFVLASPQSFTSVVGTMIGQHPQLYALPETHLFGCETMAEWWERCETQPFPRQDGLVRAVAELLFGNQSEAAVQDAIAWLRQRKQFSTAMIMEVLAARTRPRALVDKSPSVVYSVAFLERIRQAFPDAKFLHLTRHPRSHAESVMRFLDERRQRGPVPPSHWLVYLSTYPHANGNGSDAPAAYQVLDPQRGWLALNTNIRTFFETLPEPQKLVVRGEDVLGEPDTTLTRVAEWMGIRSDTAAIEEMKHPERSPYAHLGPAGAKYGNDAFFLERPELRAERGAVASLDGPVSWRPNGKGLLPAVKQLAREMGYQ